MYCENSKLKRDKPPKKQVIFDGELKTAKVDYNCVTASHRHQNLKTYLIGHYITDIMVS